MEEVEEGDDAEEERETSGSESKARELKRLVSSVEARLRDCDNSSFSVSTDDERDKSEFETALQEEIKEEKGEGAVVDIKGRGLCTVVFLVVVLCVVCRVVLLNIWP